MVLATGKVFDSVVHRCPLVTKESKRILEVPSKKVFDVQVRQVMFFFFHVMTGVM